MYFVNFSLDIAIGTFMIWCFVRVQELTAVRFGVDSLKVPTYVLPSLESPTFTAYMSMFIAVSYHRIAHVVGIF